MSRKTIWKKRFMMRYGLTTFISMTIQWCVSPWTAQLECYNLQIVPPTIKKERKKNYIPDVKSSWPKEKCKYAFFVGQSLIPPHPPISPDIPNSVKSMILDMPGLTHLPFPFKRIWTNMGSRSGASNFLGVS